MAPIFAMFAPSGGVIFTIDFAPPLKAVEAPYLRAAEYLENKRPMLALVREAFIEGVNEHFDEDGPGWAPWADSYAPIAEATNVGGLLERTGAVREGATSRSAYTVTNDDVFFTGAGMPDYWTHSQFGTGPKHGGSERAAEDAAFIARAKAAGMEVDESALGGGEPARPYIYMDAETEGKIYDIFDEWVAGAFSSFTSSAGVEQVRIRGKFGPRI